VVVTPERDPQLQKQIPQHPGSGSSSMVNWRDRAACLDEDPELFFPDGNSGDALRQTEEAKAVCLHCDVAVACLKWALDSGQDHGVWGGMSEGERRALVRGRGRVRHAS
jgi:WhiB family redox-sensing transcriptional regulator